MVLTPSSIRIGKVVTAKPMNAPTQSPVVSPRRSAKKSRWHGNMQSAILPDEARRYLAMGKSAAYGGEDGIRTHEDLLSPTPLAGERLRPLGHLSVDRWIKKTGSTINKAFGPREKTLGVRVGRVTKAGNARRFGGIRAQTGALRPIRLVNSAVSVAAG